ncbi:MAG TPA: hypothetical protein VK824_11610 [Planctomycetota bacterium]|nr:hypothetical protein [Planctomycetota bacterium]
MAALVFGLCLAASRCTAGVLIVDANGFGDHVTIQAAIDAATDGDILVVKPVAFCCASAEIHAKSLTLIADVAPGQDTANLTLGIHDVPAGGRVVVRGFHSGSQSVNDGQLTVTDCAGSVWIEDCRFARIPELLAIGPDAAAEIQGSPVVTFVRCTFTGADGSNGSVTFPPFPPSPGSAGVLLVHSVAAFHDCTATAGGGGFNSFFLGEAGAHGVELQASSAFLSGCAITGGDTGGPVPGGGTAPGGDGLHLDAASFAQQLDSTIAGGSGGEDIDAPPGAVQPFPGTARSLLVPAPKRGGQGGLLNLSGVQGDVVGFFWNIKAGLLPLPAKKGWFLLDPSLLAGPFPLAVISSPGGTLDALFVTPALPSALEGQTLLLQPFFANTDGITLGAGTAFVLLKPGL